MYVYNLHEKNSFVENGYQKNVTKYRSDNNFIELLK